MTDIVAATEPVVASPAPEMTAPDLSRRISHLLREAAVQVGLRHPEDADFEDLARAIILQAQSDRSKLAPEDYRRVWGIWQIFRRHRLGEDGRPAPFPPVA